MTKSQIKQKALEQFNNYIESNGPVGEKHSLYTKDNVISMLESAFIAGTIYGTKIT
jgi:hypothetical protein